MDVLEIRRRIKSSWVTSLIVILHLGIWTSREVLNFFQASNDLLNSFIYYSAKFINC